PPHLGLCLLHVVFTVAHPPDPFTRLVRRGVARDGGEGGRAGDEAGRRGRGRDRGRHRGRALAPAQAHEVVVGEGRLARGLAGGSDGGHARGLGGRSGGSAREWAALDRQRGHAGRNAALVVADDGRI